MGTETNTRTNSENGKGWSVPIWVAVITGIVTVVAALIGLIGTLAGVWANTTTTEPAIITPDVILTWTATAPITDTPTAGSIFDPITTHTPTLETVQSTGVMYVVLSATQSRGRPPLDVRFDVRNSYFIAPDGTRFECGACEYFWQIRQDGSKIFGPTEETGIFEYTFKARGTYFVSVYVCRSQSTTECNGSGMQIVVE